MLQRELGAVIKFHQIKSPESYQTTTHLKIENESWFVELERSWTREVCYICSFCVNSDHFFVNCQSRVWRCLNATLNQLSFKATWGELNREKWILKGETTLCCCVGEERKRGTKSPHHIQCSTAITLHFTWTYNQMGKHQGWDWEGGNGTQH